MSVSKRDIKEIKSIYKENPMEVRKVLDGQLIHLKRNIRMIDMIKKYELSFSQQKKLFKRLCIIGSCIELFFIGSCG